MNVRSDTRRGSRSLSGVGTVKTPRTKREDATDECCQEWKRLRVYVRIKPPSDREDVCLGGDSKNVNVSNSRTFAYERIFWPEGFSEKATASQAEIFEAVALPLLKAARSGYNACLLAYGQTGSGKTHSMMGHDFSCEGELSGLIPRFCNDLLREDGSSYTIEMSYFEIYKEEIFDLLATSHDRTRLRVREHPVDGPHVEGLASRPVRDFRSVKVLLDLGNARRRTSSTMRNDRSSRSHAIVQLTVTKRFEDTMIRSRVSLVDLAGSEKIRHPSVTEAHYKEGLSINRSLLSLGKVITFLSESKKGGFAPYRESTLTWLLKESLGGNSCTSILATVSPESSAVEETLSTLRYACRARKVINNVVRNEDPQHKIVRELRQEVERLKALKGRNAEDSTLESRRLAAERALQKELDRLSSDLEKAEERKRELEHQMNSFIEGAKASDIDVYKSNFIENLKQILDDSIEDNVSNMAGAYIKDIERSIDALRSFCATNCNRNLFVDEVSPSVAAMEDICDKLTMILVTK